MSTFTLQFTGSSGQILLFRNVVQTAFQGFTFFQTMKNKPTKDRSVFLSIKVPDEDLYTVYGYSDYQYKINNPVVFYQTAQN